MPRRYHNYQTTFLFNCRILLVLYLIEFYNHINRAIRPSYGASFKYSWMYVIGGMIMNLIGYCKIKSKPKICEYVMYVVNGFIYIGASLVLLSFHAYAGKGELLKNQIMPIAYIAELDGEDADYLFNNSARSITRHSSDIIGDMVFAIVVWSGILLLTCMNVLVALLEIRRLKTFGRAGGENNRDLVELLGSFMRLRSYRDEQRPVDLPPSYDEVSDRQAGVNGLQVNPNQATGQATVNEGEPLIVSCNDSSPALVPCTVDHVNEAGNDETRSKSENRSTEIDTRV